MTIFELGALGEFFGSIAVILTLIYLAFQIRQNNNLAIGTAQRELMTAFQTNLDRVRSSPRIFQQGLRDFDSMSNTEQVEFQMIMNQWVNHLEQPLRMLARGLETQDNVDIYGDVCVAILSEPGGMVIWEKCKPLFFPLSRAYIENRLANPDSLPPPIADSLPWFTLEETKNEA